MPSKSKRQGRFMRAVAHGWQPGRVKAPPLSVAREFVAADRKKRVRKATGGAIGKAARRGTPLSGGFTKPRSGVLGSFSRQLPTSPSRSMIR